MPKFLIVDDDVMVARAMTRAVRGWLPDTWTIETVSSALDGLCLVVTDKEIELVLLDRLMPDASGDAVAVHILRYRPEMKGKILISSGLDYSEQEAEYFFGELGCLQLDKPLDIEVLKTLVFAAITR
jgi:response regulator of citrate/malate metabolism